MTYQPERRADWTYHDYVQAWQEIDSRSAWLKGDLAAAVETVYGEQSLQRYAKDVGADYGALLEYRRVSRAFPESSRVLGISYGVYQALAAQPNRLELITSRSDWTVAAARELVSSRHQPPAPVPQPPVPAPSGVIQFPVQPQSQAPQSQAPQYQAPDPSEWEDHLCQDCGEVFGAPVWHCRKCGAHYHNLDDQCHNCYASRAGEQTALPLAQQPQPTTPPAPAPVRPEPVMLTLLTHDGQQVQYPEPKAKATFNQTGDVSEGGISWAQWSWNPVTGCLHGCDYCYARAIASRWADTYPAGFTPLFHHERLDAPANTRIPAAHQDDPAYRRVFVCSMADLYGRWVPDEWIKQVHESMLASPQWEYLLLTKFPAKYVGLDLPASAWLGTSVDEQKRVRIAEDAFRQVDGVKVKWLSLEPLREPLQFTDLSMFDWVVIGAQTETYQPDGLVPAFDPDPAWVVRITDQAKEAGCKVHWKPNLRKSLWFDEYPAS